MSRAFNIKSLHHNTTILGELGSDEFYDIRLYFVDKGTALKNARQQLAFFMERLTHITHDGNAPGVQILYKERSSCKIAYIAPRSTQVCVCFDDGQDIKCKNYNLAYFLSWVKKQHILSIICENRSGNSKDYVIFNEDLVFLTIKTKEDMECNYFELDFDVRPHKDIFERRMSLNDIPDKIKISDLYSILHDVEGSVDIIEDY